MASGLSGTPRLRVKGAKMTRWERVSLPLLIVRGVNNAEDGPLGASCLDAFPFPGTLDLAAGVGACTLSMDPILQKLAEKRNRKCWCFQQLILSIRD